MIILEYLFWILFIGYCYFVTMRLLWIFQQGPGEVFWQKPNAKVCHFAAAILFFIGALVLLQNFHVKYLLILLTIEYLLIAGSAVKVSDRGILANAMMARWPEVIRAQSLDASGEVVIVTRHSWQRMRLKVPADKQVAFRKILAAKGFTVMEDRSEKSESFAPPASVDLTAEEKHVRPVGDNVVIENPA
ncbi:MAG: hypothetical protein ONB44_08430 [candidate division KSB1 bacterium]|nr:hypothetical protein [candidate division KSB1 bacterium]MDZ7302155.1 hypothetical protein [candidate division KSB1 bacterium]MDZ7311265.1 hypothetical protein [candidate division KSB1 bacterium]